MSTTVEPRQSVRIVAFNSKNVQHLRTVNILAAKPSDPHHSIREFLQLTSANSTVGTHRTLMDSAGTVKGVPTIYVNGYTAPN